MWVCAILGMKLGGMDEKQKEREKYAERSWGLVGLGGLVEDED